MKAVSLSILLTLGLSVIPHSGHASDEDIINSLNARKLRQGTTLVSFSLDRQGDLVVLVQGLINGEPYSSEATIKTSDIKSVDLNDQTKVPHISIRMNRRDSIVVKDTKGERKRTDSFLISFDDKNHGPGVVESIQLLAKSVGAQ